ncbi:MAG: galactose ABC transporter substrate-binding protein [Clostridiaceae bacterium]|nr:galactose ABC transporter substrate-binding protein [Clostridiaceae bacterium]
MKRLLALVMAVVLVMSFTACGSKPPVESGNPKPVETTGGPQDKEVKPYIGITIFNYANNFVGYVRNGMDFYIKNVLNNSVDYLMVDGEDDQAVQMERIDTMISKGTNVLAVNLVDSQAASTVIEKARPYDIPIVFFNRMPTMEDLNSYDKCWYVGLDGASQGRMQGEMLAEAWEKDQAKWDTNGDGKLQYVLLMGVPGHTDTTLRASGFDEAVKKAGTPVEELERQNANWSTADAKEVMEAWIGKHNDKIEMVICSNDAMALGAVEALKGNGLITDEKYIPVIGVNALPEVSELIKSGVMLGSVLTSTYDAARAVIDLSVNAANGKTDVTEGTEWELVDNKIVLIPDSKITIDNVDTAIDAYKAAQ